MVFFGGGGGEEGMRRESGERRVEKEREREKGQEGEKMEREGEKSIFCKPHLFLGEIFTYAPLLPDLEL